ncbi:hypothetical protein BKA70DRAFT_870321 [Coprinopsis sp. MPI-PUGE-AT-0042]|nr:hypothetical protein BKA70DRAFT_870321 [Coprinopsis sp. MPI-PUGE-AT-0042]
MTEGVRNPRSNAEWQTGGCLDLRLDKRDGHSALAVGEPAHPSWYGFIPLAHPPAGDHLCTDQQRLTWQDQKVVQIREVRELGVAKKGPPGAYAGVVFTRTGKIAGYQCNLPILIIGVIGEGSRAVVHKLVHRDWLLCSNKEGHCVLVPRSHETGAD